MTVSKSLTPKATDFPSLAIENSRVHREIEPVEHPQHPALTALEEVGAAARALLEQHYAKQEQA